MLCTPFPVHRLGTMLLRGLSYRGSGDNDITVEYLHNHLESITVCLDNQLCSFLCQKLPLVLFILPIKGLHYYSCTELFLSTECASAAVCIFGGWRPSFPKDTQKVVQRKVAVKPVVLHGAVVSCVSTHQAVPLGNKR